MHINPIHDEDGQLVSFVGVQMDVSDMGVEQQPVDKGGDKVTKGVKKEEAEEEGCPDKALA